MTYTLLLQPDESTPPIRDLTAAQGKAFLAKYIPWTPPTRFTMVPVKLLRDAELSAAEKDNYVELRRELDLQRNVRGYVARKDNILRRRGLWITRRAAIDPSWQGLKASGWATVERVFDERGRIAWVYTLASTPEEAATNRAAYEERKKSGAKPPLRRLAEVEAVRDDRQPKVAHTAEEHRAVRTAIRDMVDYDALLRAHPQQLLDGYIRIIEDVICEQATQLRVGGQLLRTDDVRSRLLMLDKPTLEAVMASVAAQPALRGDARAYKLTALYHATAPRQRRMAAGAAHRVERSSMDLDKYEEMVRGYVPE